MALFTDGPPSSMDDLTGVDSQLMSVANVEGIDVTRKLGLAQDELALELHTLLGRLTCVDQPFWFPAQPMVENVVITPALKLWHTYRTLEMVYADAFNSQLNDRYAGKRDQFHAKAKWAYERLIESGVGMVLDPVPEAATPLVEPAVGGLLGGIFYVTMAWVNSAGQEGACASPADVTLVASAILVHPGAAPPRATGWNVYAGRSPEALVMQNASPIAAGQTWLQTNMPATSGRAPGSGQGPDYIQAVPRFIQRG